VILIGENVVFSCAAEREIVFLIGENFDFPIASYGDDYTFRRRRWPVFIGRIGDLRKNKPTPFHLPGERMAAKKGAKKAAKKGAAKKSGGAKKAAKGGAKKSAAKKPAKKAAKRTPNAAFMKPMQPSAALGAVVGNNPMPRTEITKKLWGYIKKNNLQDPKERRTIVADDKMKPVFGGKARVSMFEMTKLVNKHLK
jgi:upstream activation factor subunit UAF30